MSRRIGLRDRITTARIVQNISPPEAMGERVRRTVNAFRNPNGVVARPEIVGGRPTGNGEFPTVGVILRGGVLHGTGTLIGPRTVLTAAHCVNNSDPFTLAFQLGPTIGASSALSAIASDFPRDPGLTFNAGTLEHDVGLLFLPSDPLPGASRMPLNDFSQPVVVGAFVEKVGYGFTSLAASGGGTQRVVTVRINSLTGLQFSHGTTGSSVCFNDSGGPGVINNVIVGVTSSTIGCASGNDVHLVKRYLDWIRPRIQ